MLHLEAVYPETLELLKKLMDIPEFGSFNLVGGTSLALQIGHRVSVDLDLFGKVEILEQNEILELTSMLGTVELLTQTRNIFSLKIDGVKVDFVNYSYPLLKPIHKISNLRLVTLEDISAMKLAAIAGRGKRKDFIDCYFLMNYFPLQKMLDFYDQKFPDGNRFLVTKSLTYFEDAEQELEAEMIIDVSWNEVKRSITQKTNELLLK